MLPYGTSFKRYNINVLNRIIFTYRKIPISEIDSIILCNVLGHSNFYSLFLKSKIKKKDKYIEAKENLYFLTYNVFRIFSVLTKHFKKLTVQLLREYIFII